jgi:hypothetical protein
MGSGFLVKRMTVGEEVDGKRWASGLKKGIYAEVVVTV